MKAVDTSVRCSLVHGNVMVIYDIYVAFVGLNNNTK